MPNLQGASPVGRGEGDLLYATRTVSRVLRDGYFRGCQGRRCVERSGGSRVSQRRRHGLGREKLTGSPRPNCSSVISRMGCRSQGVQ